MPCSAWGSGTSVNSPPSPSIVASVASKTSRTPGSIASCREARRARRSAAPSGPRGWAPRPRPRSRPRSSRRGRAPCSDAEQQRGVGDVAGQRPALVERGGEGDHPVAGDRAVGGLEADDPAERGGLADRAAGVGADRAGREAAGDGGGRAARGAAGHPLAVPGVAAPARRRSSRSRSPSRTRPCWSCRAPGRRPRRAGARRSPYRAGGSPRGCASPPSSATPSVQKMSLTATRDARAAARSRPRPRRRPRPARGRR